MLLCACVLCSLMATWLCDDPTRLLFAVAVDWTCRWTEFFELNSFKVPDQKDYADRVQVNLQYYQANYIGIVCVNLLLAWSGSGTKARDWRENARAHPVDGRI